MYSGSAADVIDMQYLRKQ